MASFEETFPEVANFLASDRWASEGAHSTFGYGHGLVDPVAPVFVTAEPNQEIVALDGQHRRSNLP